ncbi:hypothetical protein [Pseudomonas sp. ICMP 460]|uniref:hypothetical protein n=1 Tax=Pseudomonas sp. ICMP 460 TaxID=1718917 RepID=UPI000C075303|nr:hypothetical protein [Pseudomonas sp. ICMP 460]PHN29458.1 hypothetical protein AO240_20765 [Pseudomonas sp. ICMP 460]
MIWKVFIIFLAGAATTLVADQLNLKFSYTDFKDYCNTLLAVSGMVFTIMGIWIAFIYPNAIMRLQDPVKIKTALFSKTMQDTRRLESIVGSVMGSAFVASAITLIFLAKLIISGTPFYSEYSAVIKHIALGSVVMLSLVQASAVFAVIYSNYLFVDDLHVRRESNEGDNDF